MQVLPLELSEKPYIPHPEIEPGSLCWKADTLAKYTTRDALFQIHKDYAPFFAE